MLKDTNPNDQGEDINPGGVVIDPIPQPQSVDIIVYYKHEYADYLVPEKKKVEIKEGSLEEAVIIELLKGPQNFERRPIMPAGTELIDITRKDDTVFVNLSSDFLGDIVLSDLPGKSAVPDSDLDKVLGEMKKLSIYSIVNSLTFLDGVNQVQILIENQQVTFEEMGAELLLGPSASRNASLPMGKITRNKDVILTPEVSVRHLFKQLEGKPNWDIVYLFLSSKIGSGESPTIDEFRVAMQGMEDSLIEYEGNPVIEQEYVTENKAFVIVKYTLKSNRREVTEKLTVINELDGIWKVRMPGFLEEIYQS